jgi:hypothetical protein
MKKVVRAALVAAACAGAVALPAAQASAANSGTASCDAGGFTATFWLEYHRSGNYDYIDQYQWDSSGPSQGGRNNFEGWVYDSSSTGGTKTQLHHWVSADNIKKGRGNKALPDSVRSHRSRSTWGEFKFIFDKPDDDDPRCSDATPKF